MDLESLAIRLRPRREWEAVDLGLVMVRHWRRPLFAAWLSVAAPAAAGLVLALGGLGLIAFWWLLPMAETVVIFTLSRAVFGSVPAPRETLLTLPSLVKTAVPELFLRRFHPGRAVRLPVGLLEGLKGRERLRRLAPLTSGQDAAAGLGILFLLFECGLVAALVALAVLMTPSSLGVDWDLLFERYFAGVLPQMAYRASWLLVAAVVLALHPFYIGAAFALYLARRTALEGWDLEIAFRRLARRAAALDGQREEAPGRVRGASLLLLVTIATTLGPSSAARAIQVESAEEAGGSRSEAPAPTVAWTGDPEQDPRAVIATVLERPELRREETVVRWQLRDDLLARRSSPEPKEEREASPAHLFVIGLLAQFGELVLWLLAGLLVTLVLVAMWRSQSEARSAAGPRAPPQRLFGLDLRPESLPGDVPLVAETLWTQGETRAALSLLYRGALGRLVVADRLELRESFTEDDCLRLAERRLDHDRADFFGALTRAWKQAAYAHRAPSSEEARLLWSTWGSHFGDAP